MTRPLNIIVTAIIAICYLLLLPRSIGFGDSGTLAAAVITPGIPHPTGFPSYLLIARLFAQLPFGATLLKLQLLSLFPAVILIYLLPSVFTKITLALTFTFWYQASNVESYLLTNLFVYCLTWFNLGRYSRSLFYSAILGLGGGLNPIGVTVVPVILYLHGFARQFWVFLLAMPALTLAYCYLPIIARTHPFLNWGDPHDLSRLLTYLSGSGLNITSSSFVNGFTGSLYWYAQAWVRFITLAWTQLSPLILILAGVGFVYQWRTQRRHFWTYLIILTTNVSLAGIYVSGNRDAWLLTSLITLVILAGEGISSLTKFQLPVLVSTLLTVTILNLPWIIQASRSNLSAKYISDLYQDLPPNALLLGSGETFNSLTLYAYKVQNIRPDVIPIDMSIFYGQAWYRNNLTAQNLGINTTLTHPITFSNTLEFSHMLEEFATHNSHHPIFITGSLLINPIYTNTTLPAYIPQRYQLTPHALVYELKDPDHSPLPLSTYPAPPKSNPRLGSNSQQAIENISKEYALSLEKMGDYHLLHNQPNLAYPLYVQANQMSSTYFDQNRLSSKLAPHNP